VLWLYHWVVCCGRAYHQVFLPAHRPACMLHAVFITDHGGRHPCMGHLAMAMVMAMAHG